MTDTGEAARIGGAHVSARTEDARALKPRVELTSGSHNGEDQEWIHGCRSVAGWVEESLYTSQGDGEGGACAGRGVSPLLLVQTHLQLSPSQGLASVLLCLAAMRVCTYR